MAVHSTNAPRRAWLPFAQWVKKLHLPKPHMAKLPKTLTDQQGRDIGLTAHDLEVLRHEWPSAIGRPHI